MIYAYLRASTDEQNAARATQYITDFLAGFNHTADRWVIENASGATLNRPMLNEMLNEMSSGDILIVEQVDRLTRLTAEDWRTLKRIIEDKQIRLVCIDVPTSYEALRTSEGIALTVITIVNNMLLDVLALTARKDYEDRRRRQAEGIETAKKEGKFKGRQQSEKTITAIAKAQQLVSKGYSVEDACKVVGIGRATYYRVKKADNATSNQ